MSTSPTDKKRESVSKDVFKKHVMGVNSSIDSLVEAAVAVGKLKSGQSYMVNGNEFGRKELNMYKQALKEEVRDLGRDFNASAGKRKTKKTKSGLTCMEQINKNTYFARPMMYDDELVEFFRGANLGEISENGKIVDLKTKLGFFFNTRIASPMLITTLFALYRKRNNLTDLVEDQDGKAFMGADEYMKEKLGNTFAALRAADEELDALTESRVHYNKKGQIVPPTDIDRFQQTLFSRISFYHPALKDGTWTPTRNEVYEMTTNEEGTPVVALQSGLKLEGTPVTDRLELTPEIEEEFKKESVQRAVCDMLEEIQHVNDFLKKEEKKGK